ncbi:DUF397 domain-containing protein [Streptomyces sp. ID05-47C]|uniref:DUF397 domain-containing protein n=1 Tax=Streptomyces sp. ID05-47C TaxID=3028665 RepID=UPI0029A7576A|nr:DUF397 domain-containing protein [Streptomyces sp. ID05-47C]MDX3571698.1 DUF397 domain-containing protein [Streptomyces sp. ID05-47C]
MPLPSHAWHKSSYSTDREDACVEVRVHSPGRVLVRDTKDGGSENTGRRGLALSPAAWSAFLGAIDTAGAGLRFAAP